METLPSCQARKEVLFHPIPTFTVSIKKQCLYPINLLQPSAGNFDSEPGERMSGFPLRPPTLIPGQAPRAGLQARRSPREPASRAGLQPHRRGPLRASQQQHRRAQRPAAAGTTPPGLPVPPNGDQETRCQHLKREIPRNESSYTSEEDNWEKKSKFHSKSLCLGRT